MVRFYLEKVISQFTPVYGLYLFQMTKKMQSEQLNKTDPSMRSLDTQYWLDRGWISE